MINHKDNCEHEISGSEGKAARAKCREERIREIRGRVYAVLDSHMDAVFRELDELHTVSDIDDEDILAALRAGGYTEEADLYQGWIAEKDPRRDYRDPTPWGEELVTDPMDSDSNRLMEADLKARRMAQRKVHPITFEFTEIETVRYTDRTTVNRTHLRAWLDEQRKNGSTVAENPEDIDADTLTWYLADNPGHTIEQRNREADPAVDYVDLTVVDE